MSDADQATTNDENVVRAVPVAIVGIGCRFPGGVSDPLGFWDLIASGTDAIGDIPPARWRPGGVVGAVRPPPARRDVADGIGPGRDQVPEAERVAHPPGKPAPDPDDRDGYGPDHVLVVRRRLVSIGHH